ncbi:MAG: glycosyltransferase [Lachnospiraceae bacterium]|nr:glycosyltransferase [Lachnospiraceae bacterium]
MERYVDRLFISLEAQTIGFSSLEIICVNDGSTDGTLEKLSKWEQKYPDNVVLVPLPENVRMGTCRNLGVKMASADHIAFIDSDDWVEKNYLERLYETALTYDLDLVECGMIRDAAEEITYLNEPEGAVDVIRLSGVADRKKLFHMKRVTNSPVSKIIRKEFLLRNEIFFSEGIIYEDSYWGILLNLYLENAGIMPDRLYHYCVNERSVVLTKNTDNNVDLITNQIMIWEEVERRGLMEDYRDEMEMEHVYSCALIFWKMLVYRYDDPPYSFYRLLCAVVRSRVPDIMNNPYILAGELQEKYMLLLESCLNPLPKNEFRKFAEKVRELGL